MSNFCRFGKYINPMKRQYFYFAFFLFPILFASCKKDSSTTPFTTAGSVLTNPHPIEYWPSTVWGTFEADLMLTQTGTISFDTAYQLLAKFVNASGNDTYAGEVRVNEIKLDTTSSTTAVDNYTKFLASMNLFSGIIWNLSGFDSIPSINYTIPRPLPNFTGTIPLVIHRSSGYSIALGANVIGADSVALYLGTVGSTTLVIRVAASSPSIGFTPAQLSVFDSGSYVPVLAIFFDQNIQTFGNKNYGFYTGRQIYAGATVE